jgi:ABC-type sulfate/molybdate transport systems ATPase subunit
MVRPHDVIISRTDEDGSAIPVIIKHIGIAGPIARLELERNDDRQTIDAELPLDVMKALSLSPGDKAFVTPRKTHVFEDYVI